MAKFQLTPALKDHAVKHFGVAADASDPVASSGALSSLQEIANRALATDLSGPLASLAISSKGRCVKSLRKRSTSWS